MNSGTKVILITGASSGIGKDAALRLISEGHTVYGAARRFGQMQDLVAAGGHAIQMDVTDNTSVALGVQHIVGERGNIDVLINNAGYGLYGSVEDVSLEHARHQFDVNLFGVAMVTREVLPHMRKQKFGKIINISSMGGKIYTPLGAWYHASKHAVEGWSDCLRIELKPFNIKVVVVEPGLIATDFGEVLYEPMLKFSADGPYGMMARPVANAAKNMYEKEGAASPPSVVSAAISKAIAAKKPRTRYAVGKMAWLAINFRKWFGDRIFDAFLMRQLP